MVSSSCNEAMGNSPSKTFVFSKQEVEHTCKLVSQLTSKRSIFHYMWDFASFFFESFTQNYGVVWWQLCSVPTHAQPDLPQNWTKMMFGRKIPAVHRQLPYFMLSYGTYRLQSLRQGMFAHTSQYVSSDRNMSYRAEYSLCEFFSFYHIPPSSLGQFVENDISLKLFLHISYVRLLGTFHLKHKTIRHWHSRFSAALLEKSFFCSRYTFVTCVVQLSFINKHFSLLASNHWMQLVSFLVTGWKINFKIWTSTSHNMLIFKFTCCSIVNYYIFYQHFLVLIFQVRLQKISLSNCNLDFNIYYYPTHYCIFLQYKTFTSSLEAMFCVPQYSVVYSVHSWIHIQL